MSLIVLNKYVVFQAPRTGSSSLKRHHAKTKGFYSLRQQMPSEIKPGLLADHIAALPKINVVRNPWDRAISCYNFFGTDFYSFAAYLRKVRSLWAISRESFARVPNKQIDWFVPEAETVLLKDLSERFPGIPHINKSAKSLVSFDEAYATQEAIDLVAEMYAEDIETFGFQFEKA